MNTSSIVVSCTGYFLGLTLLLGMSGIAGNVFQVPAGVNENPNNANQSFVGAVVECIFTLFGDCSEKTETATFKAITDALSFAASYVGFFFQLITFQLPIPTVLTAIIVLPPATGLAYVGIRMVRGGG